MRPRTLVRIKTQGSSLVLERHYKDTTETWAAYRILTWQASKCKVHACCINSTRGTCIPIPTLSPAPNSYSSHKLLVWQSCGMGWMQDDLCWNPAFSSSYESMNVTWFPHLKKYLHQGSLSAYYGITITISFWPTCLWIVRPRGKTFP